MGVKVILHQPGTFCQWVACSHTSASTDPPNDSTWQPCTNQKHCSCDPTSHRSTREGMRQTDWLHSLSPCHYTALSNPVYPLVFLLLVCSFTPFLSERPSTPLHFWWITQEPFEKMCDCREGWKCVEGKKGCVKLTEMLSKGSETRLNGVAENRQVDLTEEIGKLKAHGSHLVSGCPTNIFKFSMKSINKFKKTRWSNYAGENN